MHEYNANYFHFIVETIPRILMIEESNIPLDIPFIFEADLHPNIITLINILNIIFQIRKELYDLWKMQCFCRTNMNL